jgi:hypothetical protein
LKTRKLLRSNYNQVKSGKITILKLILQFHKVYVLHQIFISRVQLSTLALTTYTTFTLFCFNFFLSVIQQSTTTNNPLFFFIVDCIFFPSYCEFQTVVSSPPAIVSYSIVLFIFFPIMHWLRIILHYYLFFCFLFNLWIYFE